MKASLRIAFVNSISPWSPRALYFNDDCFTCRKRFLDEFCERYKAEFNLPFDINARPETLSDENCRQLKEAGCRRVSIGVENGDETFRAEVLGRKHSNDRIVQAFESCRKAGLKTKSFNIIHLNIITKMNNTVSVKPADCGSKQLSLAAINGSR